MGMDPGTLSALQSAHQDIGDLFSYLGPYHNPTDSAQSYYNQIPDYLRQYLGPYANAGSSILPQYSNISSNLFSNPGGSLNQIGQSYKQSPGYQFSLNQGLQAGNNAAAAGGMAGTPQHQFQNAGIAENIANQDYYNWLSHATEQEQMGMQGMGNIFNTGANSSSQLAGGLANNLMNQGNLAFAGSTLNNQRNQGLFSAIGNLL